MGRFRTAGEAPVPYSDVAPERCRPARGARFLLPGDDAPRECGSDPNMPPANELPFFERAVSLGFTRLKRRP